MIQKRRALLAALIAGGSAVPAAAGCLDWLFHKHTTPVYPYAVGFAPATTVTPWGPPVPITAPTIMQGPAMQGQVGAVSDMTPIGQPSLGPAGYMSSFGGSRSATVAQMPAYGATAAPINNPSVLTGMPVNVCAPVGGVAGLPMAAYRTSGDTVASAFYGGAVLPQASYNAAAAFQTQAPGASTGHPLQVQPQPSIGSGGILGRVLGNQYQTSYNNVPTTVYRPVQQIDPTTGQMVIVQQPCTTTTQQVQRTPYASLQPAQPPAAAPYYGEPACGNEPPGYLVPGQPAPGQSAYAPQGGLQPGSYAPIGSGISQATAIAPSHGAPQSYASPIPSTGAATTAPLQGYPDRSTQPNDAAQVQQPRLESSRPSLSPPVTSSPPWPAPPAQDSSPGNYSSPVHNGATYRTQEPTARSGDWPDHRQTSVNQPAPTSASARPDYSDLPPIPAADEYRGPAWPADPGSDAAQPARSERLPSQQRPLLSPPSPEDRTAGRSVRGSLDRSEQSARYASSQGEPQRQPIQPIAPAPRDDSGWFAIDP